MNCLVIWMHKSARLSRTAFLINKSWASTDGLIRESAFDMTLKCLYPSSEIPLIASSAFTSQKRTQGSDLAGKDHSFLGNISQHPAVITAFAFRVVWLSQVLWKKKGTLLYILKGNNCFSCMALQYNHFSHSCWRGGSPLPYLLRLGAALPCD